MATLDLTWPRWTAYEEPGDGWIYASGDRTDAYLVNDDDDLPSYLAKVAEQESYEAAVPALMDFYEKFGLLGRAMGGDLGLEEPRAFGGHIEARHGRRGLYQEFRDGDDVVWAVDHASNIRMIMRLDRARGAKLDEFLEKLVETEPALVVPLTTKPWSIHVDSAKVRSQAVKPLALARVIVAELLNPNLVTVAPAFDPIANAPCFRCRSLLEAIYWRLFNSLRQFRMKRCACGSLFFATDPRQKFCPAIDGQSRCSKKFWMRKNRRMERLNRKKTHRA